jgi:ABC-type branched-subunit amino acid transport system ATPase component
MTLLELHQVTRSFGRVTAVDAVTTTVEEGEIRGLIGPNGAGKTTLVNLLSGFLAPTRGRIVLAGSPIDAQPAHARVRHGIGRTFQTPQLCPAMSTLDNIVIGAHQRLATARFRNLLSRGRRSTLAELREEAARVGGEVGLGALLDIPAGALSYGHMRLTEIARALLSRPRLLLLDEPVAGMNESESSAVADIVRGLRARGTTVLVIEHDMPFVMGLCDRITVLDHGTLISEGTPLEVQHDARVEEVYLGTLGDAQ